MNSSLKIALAGFAAILIVGCGSSGDSKNVSASDLKGNWNGTCDVDGSSSQQDFFTMTDKVINVQHIEFSNPTCNKVDREILLDETEDFSYVLGDDIEASGKKVSKIDLTQTGYHLSKGNTNEIPNFGEVIYQIIYKENNKLFLGKSDKDHNLTSDATRAIVLDFANPIIKQ